MNIRAKTLVRRQFKIFSDFHQGAVKVLCLPSFVSDIVLSGGDDNLIKIWNTSTGSSIKNLYGNTKKRFDIYTNCKVIHFLFLFLSLYFF